jgi:hypothetical protein
VALFVNIYGYGARFSTEIYTRGCHWFPRLLASCSLEASRRVTNDIPLGCPLYLPVHPVNCVQTLKGRVQKRAIKGWEEHYLVCPEPAV